MISLRNRRAEFLLVVVVLVGAASFGWARMAAGEERAIPYQGVLEEGGVAKDGVVGLRFTLFPALATGASVWTEDQDVDVDNGRFAVVLGDGDGDVLSDAVLARPALFLEIAVDDGTGSFTTLSPRQEIVPVPLAARAAIAATVGGNGVDSAAIQAGAITSNKLANGLFFSADVIVSGGAATATNVTPSNWVGFSSIPSGGNSVFVFPFNTFGVTHYKCSVTGLGDVPRLFTIADAQGGQIVVKTFDAGGAPTAPTVSFTLLCQGF